jgi:hypothetical protein
LFCVIKQRYSAHISNNRPSSFVANISKASFDVAFLDDDKYQNKKFKNDLKGDLNKTSLKTYWDALCHYLLIQSPLDSVIKNSFWCCSANLECQCC